jgi:lipoprotein-releasing system permease protein
VNLRFSAFVGYRYFRARRRSSGASSTRFAVLGVAVGVMTLTAVLGVMNGFQLGFIDSILEISSYHIQARVRLPAGEAGAARLAAILAGLRRLPGVRAAVPFRERQVLLNGPFGEQRGCLVRGLPGDVAQNDQGFARRLVVEEGVFDLTSPGSLVLGAELAQHIGVSVGDSVEVLTLGGSSFNTLSPQTQRFSVAGLFRSGYYDFDLGWAFVGLQEAQALGPAGDTELSIGVKLRNRFRDQSAAEAVRRVLERLGVEDPQVASWREFNRAFFGALRVEKIMMMVLIGLIFVVVGFSISQSLRRAVRERYEEIGVLKALGAGEGAIRDVFVLEGLLIGLIGGGLGLLAGLLISANINAVFAAAEALVNFLLAALRVVAAPFAAAAGERFTLFSPTYFYISEIPSRVLPGEAVLIIVFAVVSPTVAALAATRPVRRVRPAEVLRYE